MFFDKTRNSHSEASLQSLFLSLLSVLIQYLYITPVKVV